MTTQKNHSQAYVLGMLVCFLFLITPGSPVLGQEVDCLKCHGKLKADKVVHAAMDMGCATCHGGIDAAKVPHKQTNKIAKGLTSEQPDLCYGCHDKSAFAKQNVHAAVGMGCTGCHNPHSSKNAKLLKAEPLDLCYTCHDKKAFTKKTVHAPVAGGMCLGCHSPHASDEMALLLKKPLDVCLECHAEVPKKPHAVAGITASSHPLEPTSKRKTKQKGEWVEVTIKHKDPARPDKPFYCGSCHDPHSTDSPYLFRFNAKSTMALCGNCHKM